MAKVRQILKAVTVQEAKRGRICHRNREQHAIGKGECCLVVQEPAGGYKNYCKVCAGAILDIAEKDIRSLRKALA